VLKVPLLDLHAQYEPIRAELMAAIARVCDAQRFILGPEVDGLERELASYLEAGDAVGVSSGTDALLMALMALDIGPGDEVVTSAYSFFATAGSISRVGARPVFVDIDPATFNLEPDAVAAALTPKTRAIIPVHLFGQSAELGPILDVAKRAGVWVVEDAAQAIGARYRGRAAGTWGAIGCFSFFPSKNLGGFGDGGLVTANDPGIAARLRVLRHHGAEAKYAHGVVGGNFRLDAIQAAVLRVKLPYLSEWNAARQRNARRYAELFDSAGLRDVVRVPAEAPDRTHIYNQFVIRAAERDRLRTHLESRGVGTEVYYPIPLHLQKCFAGLGHAAGAFPNAEAASREALALPIYAELTADQQAWVVDGIRSFYRGSH
jgi:dTDP-4-amino-4,6-dideoxygalactose transaminase